MAKIWIVGLFLAVAVSARSQSDVMHIASFDTGELKSISGLALWLFADEQFGGTSHVRATLLRPGANSSSGAVHIAFRVTGDSPMPFAGIWAMVGKDGLPVDLRAYRGVRFFAKSKTRDAFTAGIVQFCAGVQRYAATFEATPDWSLIELPFDKFHGPPPPTGPVPCSSALDPHDVTAIGMNVAPGRRGEFELDIDEIACYR